MIVLIILASCFSAAGTYLFPRYSLTLSETSSNYTLWSRRLCKGLWSQSKRIHFFDMLPEGADTHYQTFFLLVANVCLVLWLLSFFTSFQFLFCFVLWLTFFIICHFSIIFMVPYHLYIIWWLHMERWSFGVLLQVPPPPYLFCTLTCLRLAEVPIFRTQSWQGCGPLWRGGSTSSKCLPSQSCRKGSSVDEWQCHSNGIPEEARGNVPLTICRLAKEIMSGQNSVWSTSPQDIFRRTFLWTS